MGKKKLQKKEVEHDADPSTFLNKKKKHHENSDTNDMPRSFKKILRYQKFSEEKAKEKARGKQGAKNKPAPLKLKKGESLSEFGQRVNEAIPLPLAKGVNSAKSERTAAKQRKKADNLRTEHHEIMVKRGRGRNNDSDDDTVEWKQRGSSPDPWDSVNAKNKKPKFGEVADRPPELPTLKRLSNVPKAAGSQARREILEKERNSVIEAYRKMREA